MRPLDPLTIPLTGRNLIEASAGTGKTYTLVFLVLRHLLEQRRRISEILVVTFTNAATEELCDRIRHRLRQALDLLDDEGSAGDPMLSKYLAAFADRLLIRRQLEEALVSMDEAAIYTIHGFCQRVLQDHAFAANTPLTVEFLETEDDLRLQILEDFWRNRFYVVASDQAAWVADHFTDPRTLLALLRPLFSRLDATVLPEIDPEQLRLRRNLLASELGAVRELWFANRQSLHSLLESSPALKRNQDAYRLHDQLPLLMAAMDRVAEASNLPWRFPPILGLLTDTGLADNSKKGKTPPTHPFFTVFDRFFAEMIDFLEQERMSVLLDAHAYLSQELRRRKASKAWLSFDDLLTGLDSALLDPRCGSRMAADLRERYPVALVDEFQDTDPVQYRIFSKIYAGHGGSLTLIGDPKQAIYAFRGADIHTYLRARRDCPPENRYTMTTNYRSSEPMVQAVNTLFCHGNPFLFAEIETPEMNAAGYADNTPLLVDGQRPCPFTALMPITGGPDRQDPPPANVANLRLAAAAICVAKIDSLLTADATIGGKALAAGDIAVLVRTHHEASIMQAALRKRRIGSVLFSQESVFASDEAGQLFQVLTALANLADRSLVATALATDLFGHDGATLHALLHSSRDWDQCLTRLQGYSQLWQEQGIFPLVRRILRDNGVTERLTGYPGGDRALTNFLHLAELLQERASEIQGPSPLLHWFSRQLADQERQGLDRQLRLENDERLVQIVTMHKAKGLQYPVVLLPFLWTGRPPENKGPLVYHQDERTIINLDRSRPEVQQTAEHELQAEEMRLLYVALTRAVHACYFTWFPVRQNAHAALSRLVHVNEFNAVAANRPGAGLGRLAEHQDLIAIEASSQEALTWAPTASPPTVQAKTATFAGRIDDSWRITSYSQLAGGQASQHRPQDDHDEPGVLPEGIFSVHTFPKGAEPGTCLHGILEAIDFQSSPEHWDPHICQQLERAAISSQWLPTVRDWLHDIIRTPLPCGCRLVDLTPSRMIQEMAFLFPLDRFKNDHFNRILGAHRIPEANLPAASLSGMMKGYIDLVFNWQGRFYLADFKSNHLGPSFECYNPLALERVMAEHRYDLQYLIYCVALTRYLKQRLPGFSYERDFGGAYYLFLRGMRIDDGSGAAIVATRPPESLISAIDQCFAGESV